MSGLGLVCCSDVIYFCALLWSSVVDINGDLFCIMHIPLQLKKNKKRIAPVKNKVLHVSAYFEFTNGANQENMNESNKRCGENTQLLQELGPCPLTMYFIL